MKYHFENLLFFKKSIVRISSFRVFSEKHFNIFFIDTLCTYFYQLSYPYVLVYTGDNYKQSWKSVLGSRVTCQSSVQALKLNFFVV